MTAIPILEVDAANFDTAVGQANTPVWLDFWGENCQACKTVAGWLARLPARFDNRLSVAKINVYQNEALVKRFGVQSIPTLVFWADGQESHRQTDQIDEAGLHALLDRLLAAEAAAGGQ